MNLEFDKAGKSSETQLREPQILSSEFICYLSHFCLLKKERAQRIQLTVFEGTASGLVLYQAHEAYTYFNLAHMNKLRMRTACVTLGE
jgi:hypothetical protein